jgi:ribosomal RNA assembly protein
MLEAILVPEERVKVFTQEVREELENETGVTMKIENNAIVLEGEGLEMLGAKNFIRAVGRGFSPERAWQVLGEDQVLEVIDLSNLTEAQQRNARARIIGTEGRMREKIEESTGALVSVQGKTVSLIGTWEDAQKARLAIEMIIKGAEMTTVSRHLMRLGNRGRA